MGRCYQLMCLVLLLLVCGGSASAESAAERFREDSEYRLIDPALPLADHKDKVEVVEMFLYACPHCYELEPKMRRWLKDKPYVDFLRIPAIVAPSWADQARAFYIMKELGQPESLHQALFKAIHENGLQIYNQHGVVEFFVSQGIDLQTVLDLYSSPEIASGVNEARIKTVKYGLSGVPAVIVNGKYKTAPYFVRDQDEMFEVLDSLVEDERKRQMAAELTK